LSVLASEKSSKGCQYFLNMDVGYPIGTGKCNYYVYTEGEYAGQHSFVYECVTPQLVQMYTYATYDCKGIHTTTTYTPINGTFSCQGHKKMCGTTFGYKTPCECTLYNGDCDAAVGMALVKDICVYSQKNGTMSYSWDITCGRVNVANARVTRFHTPDCTGTPSGSTTYPAGCFSNPAYEHTFNASEIDWVVCPGNVPTWSLSVLALVVAAAFSL